MYLPQTEDQERGVVILFVILQRMSKTIDSSFYSLQRFSPKTMVYMKADKYILKFYLDTN